MENILSIIASFGSSVLTAIIVLAVYFLVKKIMDRQARGKTDAGLIRGIVLFVIALVGLIIIILALPMNDSLRGQVTSLIGIVISAVLALSSATFIGNALAGIMLRAMNNFRVGDFVKANEHFGRVTERGLFHTEIQTKNRDLLTLPNLYLATHPVKVTRSSGTFISGVCSLGYDVNRQLIERTLLSAAKKANLEDPFVRIQELGDFSVVYEVYGLISEVKTIISAKSRLLAMMLDELHAAGIEIVSPNFMNQRQVGEMVFIPKKIRNNKVEKESKQSPEDKIFDKADEAESIANQKHRVKGMEEQIKNLQEQLKSESQEEAKAKIGIKIEKLQAIKERIIERIDQKINK